MKFSTVLSLGAAHMAVAKSVNNVYPHARREPNSHHGGAASVVSAEKVSIDPALLAAAGLRGHGLSSNARTEVILIWVNPGNNDHTTAINKQQTVTQTVTVGSKETAAPPPPPAAGGEAAATTTEGGAAASTTVAGTGATHTVSVGGPKGLQFEPTELKAAIGDMVIFTFLSQNHTATQSSFDKPCEPLEGGMDTSFQPNPNNTVNPPPQVAMQVMVDKPLWFYCAQAKHCGKGMTFSINPTAEKTQAMFQQLAIAQQGAGTGSAITGNGSAAPPPAAPAPPAEGAASSPAPAGTATASIGAGTGGAASAAPASGTGAVGGVGTTNPDGSCSCAVMCSPGSFPAVQAQGVGAFGGIPGGIPAEMVAAR